MTVLLLILTAIIAYFFGMLPGAILISRYYFRSDVRRGGRCNPTYGEFRSRYGTKGLVMLLVFDALKGLIPVLIGGLLLSAGKLDMAAEGRLFAALCVLLGHNFPIVYRFLGGQGAFCAGVMLIAVDWRVALCCWGAYIVVLVFTRYLSLSAIVACVLCPVFMWVFQYGGLDGVLALLCAVAVILKYVDSIRRLISGAEPQLNIGAPRRGEDEYDDEGEDY